MINPKINFKNNNEEIKYYGKEKFNRARMTNNHRKDWRKSYEIYSDQENNRNPPKGFDKPDVEGKYHYRYDDPYDIDHIDCVECGAPYAYSWTNKEKQKLACSCGKDHYHCTFNHTLDWKANNGEKIVKNFSKKFVCFSCRNIIKRPYNQTWYWSMGERRNPGPWTYKSDREKKISFAWPKCTDCKKNMTCVNTVFKAPKKSDIKAWKYMEENWYDDSKLTFEEVPYF